MVMIDAISRLVPGVLSNDTSAKDESFQDGLLEYPQYTRPRRISWEKGTRSSFVGHHANIEKWRREQSLERTWRRRPDLLEHADLTRTDRIYLESLSKDLDL